MSSERAKPGLSMRGLSFAAGGAALVDSVTLVLDPDGVTVVMGPNGAGKSLLLRLIAGLVEPTGGEVRAGLPRFALVAQQPVLLRRSVAANLAHALKIYGVPSRRRSGRIADLLALAGLEKMADRPARVLSGGEQQRLSLARALAMQPDVLLLDEPTASLDPQATAAIEQVVRRVSAEGVKVVFVTHDRDQAKRLANEVVFLHRGRLVEQTGAPEFFETPKSGEARAYLAGDLLL